MVNGKFWPRRLFQIDNGKIMFKIILTLCLLTWGSLPAAQEQDATDDLLARLSEIGSLQGQFRQQQYDDKGEPVAESSGRFRLLRPGYFSWEIETPDSQLIVATPEYIWHHDRDLETVTRRPVNDSEQMSPLQVLGGDEALLRERFRVSKNTAGGFSLSPSGINPGFQLITVSFEDGVFAGLEISDNMNQRIVINFSEIDRVMQLSAEDFLFAPPDGSDLFYYDD